MGHASTRGWQWEGWVVTGPPLGLHLRCRAPLITSDRLILRKSRTDSTTHTPGMWLNPARCPAAVSFTSPPGDCAVTLQGRAAPACNPCPPVMGKRCTSHRHACAPAMPTPGVGRPSFYVCPSGNLFPQATNSAPVGVLYFAPTPRFPLLYPTGGPPPFPPPPHIEAPHPISLECALPTLGCSRSSSHGLREETMNEEARSEAQPQLWSLQPQPCLLAWFP